MKREKKRRVARKSMGNNIWKTSISCSPYRIFLYIDREMGWKRQTQWSDEGVEQIWKKMKRGGGCTDYFSVTFYSDEKVAVN